MYMHVHVCVLSYNNYLYCIVYTMCIVHSAMYCVCVQVVEEEWKYRTENCTVPSGALEKTENLFTAEVRGWGGGSDE